MSKLGENLHPLCMGNHVAAVANNFPLSCLSHDFVGLSNGTPVILRVWSKRADSKFEERAPDTNGTSSVCLVKNKRTA